MQPPASKLSLRTLPARVLDEFGLSLDDAYLEFLSVCNGLDFNGTLFFASDTTASVNNPRHSIEGVVEANRVRRENAEFLLVYGESGMEMYAFDSRQRDFAMIDQVSLDRYETFRSLPALIGAALKKRL